MSELKESSKNRPSGGPPMGGPMGAGIGAPPQKANDFKGTMSKLIQYLRPYQGKMMLVFVFAISSTIFTIVGPKMLGKVTTKLFEGLIAYYTKSGLLTDFGYIRTMLLILLGLYVLSLIFGYIQGYIMSAVSMEVTYKLRQNISEKINRMPLKYFDTNTHGEVQSKVTNDVDTISQTLNQSLSQIITSVTSVLGVLVMMLSISWLMTLASLLIIPMSSMLVMVVVKKSQIHFKNMQEYMGNINGHVEEMYSGHLVVKAFNGEQKSILKFEEYNKSMKNSVLQSQFLSGMMMPIMNFMGNISYVVVCILGGYLAVNGNLNVGDIQSFIQYVRSFTQPIIQLATISNTLQSTAAAAERVFQFLDEEEEVPDPINSVTPEKVVGDIEFKNVRFGYSEDKIIIGDFSEHVSAGERVAIVGPTGAGKTTMIKLLMRFYDINSGQIIIDGHDIREFTRNDLRSMFGMVLQDTWLYNGSIMDNIRYGRVDASDEEVIEAAIAAHADGFIRALPGGYSMELNEEASNISQGQKQLLTIARAILADPQILILDEATSSVDTRTEVLIQKAMEKLMVGRTSFVIAHRLSTIRDADIILVMKDGDVIEQGSHTELIAAKGFYAGLYNSQFDTGVDE